MARETSSHSPSLWDATTIGTMHLANRFWRGALYERWATDEGFMTPQLLQVYKELIDGGVGTILTGYTRVMADDFPNPNMTAIYSDQHIASYLPLTSYAKEHGCALVMQLVYGGARTNVPVEGRKVWGPSAVANQRTGVVPQEMTEQDIAQLIEAFAAAAARAKAAGFDGVQIHAAHGYMLSTWLCPHYNLRQDKYGGSIANRGRIILEILAAIKNRCGETYPAFIKFNCQDYMADGLTEEDSIALVKMLEEAGIDGVEISGGNECDPAVAAADLGPSRKKLARHPERSSYFAAYARKLSRETSVPIILTGGNRFLSVLEGLLEEGAAQYFGLARPLNSEPDLIATWKKDPDHEPACVACNKCFTTVGHRCILNPGTELL